MEIDHISEVHNSSEEDPTRRIHFGKLNEGETQTEKVFNSNDEIEEIEWVCVNCLKLPHPMTQLEALRHVRKNNLFENGN